MQVVRTVIIYTFLGISTDYSKSSFQVITLKVAPSMQSYYLDLLAITLFNYFEKYPTFPMPETDA